MAGNSRKKALTRGTTKDKATEADTGQKGISQVRVPLGVFIDDNYRLLSAVGILTALTVLAGNLEPKGVGYLLSFFVLGASGLVLIEILTKIRTVEMTASLVLFHVFLSFAFTILLFYWLSRFRTLVIVSLWVPIWLLMIRLVWPGISLVTDRLVARAKTNFTKNVLKILGFASGFVWGAAAYVPSVNLSLLVAQYLDVLIQNWEEFVERFAR